MTLHRLIKYTMYHCSHEMVFIFCFICFHVIVICTTIVVDGMEASFVRVNVWGNRSEIDKDYYSYEGKTSCFNMKAAWHSAARS